MIILGLIGIFIIIALFIMVDEMIESIIKAIPTYLFYIKQYIKERLT